MKGKLVSRAFAFIVLFFMVFWLIRYFFGLQPLFAQTFGPIPGLPHWWQMIMVVLIGLELRRPRTIWRLQKPMIPLAVVSIIVMVFYVLGSNMLQGIQGGELFPGGILARPLDQIIIDTFIIGFFFAIYLLFVPSPRIAWAPVPFSIIDGVIRPVIAVAGGAGVMGIPGLFLEDHIPNLIVLAMFAYWFTRRKRFFTPAERSIKGLFSLK